MFCDFHRNTAKVAQGVFSYEFGAKSAHYTLRKSFWRYMT